MHFKAKTPRIASKKSLFNVIVPSVLLALFSVDAFAATTVSWIIDGSNNWAFTPGWSTGDVPDPSDTVQIAYGPASTVNITSQPYSAALVYVGNQSAPVIPPSGLLSGNLNITGGGALNVASFFTVGSGVSNSQVTVDASTLSSAVLLVGSDPGGVGSLTAQNGATVSTTSSGAGVVIGQNGGTGSVFLNSGLNSSATLSTRNVLLDGAGGLLSFDGGILKASASTTNFISANSTYTLLINGGGATIDSNGFDIGTNLVFSGSGKLTKDGAGKLTLTGANTYIGGTSIVNGTLQLGDGITTGSVSNTGGISVLTNALVLAPSLATPLTYGGIISGTGTINQAGPGTTKLINNNTFTGQTTISGGTLNIGGNTGLGSLVGPITIGSSGNLTFERTNFASYGGILDGTGTLTKLNNNFLTLTGNSSSYTGTTTISAGTLQLGDGTTTGTLGGNIVDNAVLLFDPSPLTPLTYGGVITGTGTVTLSAGLDKKTTLTGNSTAFSGSTTVSNGTTLNLGGNTGSGIIAGPIAINNGGNLTFERTDDLTYGGVLSGTGTLTKLNGNTLTLTGDSPSYTGITTISAGKLNLGGGGPTGSVGGNIAIASGANLTFERNNDVEYSGVLSGTGTLTKLSNNFLALTEDSSSYTGTTTISSGVLALGNSVTTGNLGGNIVDNAALVFDPSAIVPLTYGGVITGVGTVTAFNGYTTLTGNSTSFSGSTIVSSGSTLNLGGNTDSGIIEGPITIRIGCNLIFERTDDLTYGGVLSGPGTLTKLNGNTLTLTGDSPSYTGVTTISDGKLQLGNGGSTGSVGGHINVASLTELIFNRSNTLTYGGVISGAGAVRQAGTGTTVLTNASTYSGGTNIDAGTLAIGDAANVTASITSNTNVNAGGTLAGYGSVIGNVVNDGTVAPGSGTSVGSLTIQGNYTQSSSGTYFTHLGDAGNNNQLNITGTAALAGELSVDASDGFQPSTVYTLLTAAGGLGGSRFDSLDINGVPPSPFLNVRLLYPLEQSVTLQLNFNPFAFESAALTPNQKAVADYILLTGGTPEIEALISSLETPAQFQAAMDQLSGATYANQTVAIAHVGSWFEREMANRFLAFPSCSNPQCGRSNDEESAYRNCENAKSAWVSVYGGRDDINAGQVSGFVTDSAGVALGYEWPVSGEIKLGVAAGYTHFNGDATNRETASNDGNLLQGGFYGRYQNAGWLLGAAIDAGTTNSLSAERQVQGAIGVVSPKSNYGANLLSEQVVLSYDPSYDPMGSSQTCFRLRPYVGFINQQVRRNSFTESGGDLAFALNVQSDTYHSARSQLGLLWEAPVMARVKPFASVDWQHEFADQNGQFNASLVGVVSPATFHIVGQEIGRDSAAVRAGLVLAQQGNFDLSVLYQGQFANAWQQNGAALEASFRFD